MFKLNSLLIFSANPKALADFYQKVLEQKPGWTGGDFIGFMVGTGGLMIGPHKDVHGSNKNPERIIFNFETPDVKKESERLKKMGVKVIAQPYQPDEDPKMWIATFADPDGNYFQLATPMEM